MSTCIMLGNGINRCLFSNNSWGDILEELAIQYKVDINKNISFPMQFENIVNQILKKSKSPSDQIYTDLKHKIIDHIKSLELPLNSLYLDFVNNADDIITTNYDYLIEQNLNKAGWQVNFTTVANNKYNINNYNSVGDKKIYHIHGDIQHAQSICLGYEHYAGTLQHLREKIVTKNKVNEISKPAIIWHLEKQNSKIDSWATKFFTDNIHIVGFGLSQSEIDIWWLITYRAYLCYSNRFNAKNLIKNNITYHDVSCDKDSHLEYVLKDCAVNYKFHKIYTKDNKEYQDTYKFIAQQIRQNE